MKNKRVLWSFLSVLVLVAAYFAACSSGSSNGGPLGMAAIVIRDGTVQSSDGRTVTSVFVEISQITLRMDDDADDDEDDDEERGDHHAMSDNGDGDDDEHEHGDDDEDDGDEIKVVVFDMFRDNGGVPRELDLLTLTDSGVLLNMRRIPVGAYDQARVKLVGATAVFEDDPTQTPVQLVLDGESEDGTVFKIDFEPPVEVTETGTTVAAIDIVPVITLEGSTYTLSNDDSSDHSGNCGDGELEIEVEGTVSAIEGDQLHLVNFPLVIDLSQIGPVLVFPGMEVEVSGFMDDGVMIAERLEVED